MVIRNLQEAIDYATCGPPRQPPPHPQNVLLGLRKPGQPKLHCSGAGTGGNMALIYDRQPYHLHRRPRAHYPLCRIPSLRFFDVALWGERRRRRHGEARGMTGILARVTQRLLLDKRGRRSTFYMERFHGPDALGSMQPSVREGVQAMQGLIDIDHVLECFWSLSHAPDSHRRHSHVSETTTVFQQHEAPGTIFFACRFTNTSACDDDFERPSVPARSP